jgi:hypothetical protein
MKYITFIYTSWSPEFTTRILGPFDNFQDSFVDTINAWYGENWGYEDVAILKFDHKNHLIGGQRIYGDEMLDIQSKVIFEYNGSDILEVLNK